MRYPLPRMGKVLRFLVWLGVLSGLLLAAARLTAIRWWRVPVDDPWLEASVAPTVGGGDWLLLWRLTKPGFGDLVLCPEPGAPERVVVGRLVGEAKDRIRFVKGQLHLNGRRVSTVHSCLPNTFEVLDPDSGRPVEQHCSMEDLDGILHSMGQIGRHPFKDTTEEAVVPEGELFLVSDNRLFPYDSRDFGTVPRASCREAIFFRLWSRRGLKDVAGRFTYIR